MHSFIHPVLYPFIHPFIQIFNALSMYAFCHTLFIHSFVQMSTHPIFLLICVLTHPAMHMRSCDDLVTLLLIHRS